MRVASLRYLILRLVRASATLMAVVALVFVLVRLVPGDPVRAMLGDQASPEDRAQLRRNLHLDRPLPQQLGSFVADLRAGSWGYSFRRPQTTVRSLVDEALPHTLELAAASLLLSWLFALPLGVLAGVYRERSLDRLSSAASLIGAALPAIWLGPLLLWLFCLNVRALPLPGDDEASPWLRLLLPSLTVALGLAALLVRHLRAEVGKIMQTLFIHAARARGLPRSRVVWVHALRNALLPIVTVSAAQLGALLSGALVTEKIFERPGLGTLLLEAFFARDFPVIQGCVLMTSGFYVLVNLLLDLSYVWIDPRIRLQ